MNKLGRKGMTSVELLGLVLCMVLVVTGVVYFLGKASEEKRSDSFLKLAKEYGEAVSSNLMSADISCTVGGDEINASSLPDGKYSVLLSNVKEDGSLDIQNAYQNAVGLVKNGGKSPWGDGKFKGYVIIDTKSGKKTYYVQIIDSSSHGIIIDQDKPVSYKDLSLDSIVETDISLDKAFDGAPQYRCTLL